MARGVLAILALSSLGGEIYAEEYGNRLGQGHGVGLQYVTRSRSTLINAIDPRVQKWYMPQELYREYRLKQWEYTNYARNFYRSYLSATLEGDYFYDLFGRRVMHGWLVYEARKEQPRASEGNSLLKGLPYGGNFQNLIIASDSKGQHHFSLTIGDEIATTLTPMTFRKAAFNGVQFHYLQNRYAGTVLLSRISAPLVTTSSFDVGLTNATELTAGRLTAQLGDHLAVGGTYVNSHNSRATLERFAGNMFKGFLTTDQASNAVAFVEVRLGDDSPEDGENGAVLFAENIILTDVLGHQWTGAQVGYAPSRTGGELRDGFAVADGGDRMVLRYNLEALAAARVVEVDGEPTWRPTTVDSLAEVRFELALANDYRVEVASNRQTNIEAQPVFLLVERAPGNVGDTSNRRTVRFDYGLPTANQLAGLTLEVRQLWGFDLYAELNVNHRFAQYPSPLLATHRTSASRAAAWMVEFAHRRSPYFLHGEVFSMDPDYTTSVFMTETNGRVDYVDQESFLYDYVDDNDDLDRFPDQKRRWQSSRLGQTLSTGEGAADPAVFPGWDENGDFISDFNQNDTPTRRNALADYAEPFLRFNVDRPEFLFGLDMNNNGWIDRFEDDADPDYPYDRDRRGYNVYGGVDILPKVRLIAGQTRQWQLSSKRRSEAAYGLFVLEQDWPGLGRLRFFEHLKKVRDNIADDRLAAPLALGDQQAVVADRLAAQNTWIHTAWLGFDYTGLTSLQVINKFKYEVFYQRDEQAVLAARGTRRLGHFWGVVNKAEYGRDLGRVHLRPRLKNELFWDVPALERASERQWWKQLLSFSVRFPVFRESWIETGVEQVFTTDLAAAPKQRAEGERTGDGQQTVLAIELTNYGTYLGYRSIMQCGLRFDRDQFERVGRSPATQTGSLVFVSFYAGLE